MTHRLFGMVGALALTLGVFAFAVAQDPPAAGTGDAGACATPAATPGATPMATMATSPAASPAALDACATPSAGTPAAGGDAGAVMVDVRDFAYNPDPIEVAIGGTVTWTNQDAAPHTATGVDKDALQSGTLNQGASYSQSFATAGEYPYFCEFHANMTGTIVVE